MKAFIRQFLIFTFLLFSVQALVILIYIYQMRGSLLKNDQIETIILGDSHTQNGIDPNYFNNAINLSASGEAYWYSYAKLKFILHSQNPDKVVLALSCHNIDEKVDSLWLYNEGNYAEKIGTYFPIMTFEDIVYISNHFGISDVLSAIDNGIRQSYYSIEYQVMKGKLPFIGGYTRNTGTFSGSHGSLQKEEETILSTEQINTLKKIESLCSEKEITLYLIDMPTYMDKCKPDSKIQLESKLIDLSNLFTESKYFADVNHLNPTGADSVSRYLSQIID